MLAAIAMVALLSTQGAHAADPSASELEAAAKQGFVIETSYEERAIPVYFGHGADLMQKCAPLGSPSAAPFVLYIVVSASGRIERQVSIPRSPVAEGLVKATCKRTLPPPRASLVLKVEMRFSGGSPTTLGGGNGESGGGRTGSDLRSSRAQHPPPPVVIPAMRKEWKTNC